MCTGIAYGTPMLKIYDAVANEVGRRFAKKDLPIVSLDIGAGRGDLLKRISSFHKIQPHACDYHVERFDHGICEIRKVDLNKDILPYEDNQFDLVTCSEVFEHLENYHSAIREAFRVLKKGGVFIVTTPNVLNMKSRVRYLSSGFVNLFGPLPVKTDDYYSMGKHITPIPYFYLANSLMDAGFMDIGLSVDKTQMTSLLYLVLLFPILWPLWKVFLYNEERKGKLTNANRIHVSRHISTPVMTGRTIVLSALKA